MWELAAVGLPAVVGIVADNQESGSLAAAERGVVNVVDCRRRRPDDAAARLVDALAQLLADPTGRRRMSDAGQRLLDFDGPARISEVIEREVMRRLAP